MKVIVTSRHMDMSEDLRAYIVEKARKLSRYYDRIHEVDVIVTLQRGMHVVEIIARADHHHRFVATHSHADPFAATDQVAEHVERQLSRHKEKHRNRKHLARRTAKGAPVARSRSRARKTED